MSRLIVKLTDGNDSFYLEWSSVVDAPVTPGMSLEDFTEHIRWRYGMEGIKALPERMERVEKYGTCSVYGETATEAMSFNRAGESETRLTYTQILNSYCRNPEGETDLGVRTDDTNCTPDGAQFIFDDRKSE